MIYINPLFPIYISKDKIRAGNLPVTGKYIDNPPETIVDLFYFVSERGRTRDEINSFLLKRKINSDTIDKTIKFLIDNDFFTDNLEMIQKKGKKNREILFFSTFSGICEGSNQFEKLCKKTVAVIGVGAIGNSVLDILARAGISNFELIDFDNVDYSNLQRQIMFFYQDIGKKKVDIAKKRLLSINPNANVVIQKKDFLNNHFKLLLDPDIIICSADSSIMDIREKLNLLSITKKIPIVFAGFSEYLGIVGPLLIPGETPCWRCITDSLGSLPVNINNNSTSPSFGALCVTIGSILGIEIIKFLTNFSPCQIVGSELSYDLVTSKTNIKTWKTEVKCPLCGFDHE